MKSDFNFNGNKTKKWNIFDTNFVTLDDLFLYKIKRLDLIKLDVDGF